MNEIVTFLQAWDSPLGWVLAFLFFIIPVILSGARKIVLFHDEHIRYYRTKGFDHALERLSPDSDEYKLLEECKAQELVFLNTKLRLSRPERAQILEWLIHYPVTIRLIRRSWTSTRLKSGRLEIHVPWYEYAFIIYLLCSALAFLIISSVFLMKLLLPVIQEGAYHYLLLPAMGYLISLGMLSLVVPVVAARALKYRLGQKPAKQNAEMDVEQGCKL